MFYSRKPAQDMKINGRVIGDKTQAIPKGSWQTVSISPGKPLVIPDYVKAVENVWCGMYLNVSGEPGTQVDVQFVRQGGDATGLQSFVIGPRRTLFVTHWHLIDNKQITVTAQVRASAPVSIGTRYLKSAAA